MRIIDSDVAIDVLRDVPCAVATVAKELRRGENVVASEVTRFEILSGLITGEEEATETFFAQLEWIPVVETIARRAGELARTYRAANKGIDDPDYLVAATALELDASLLTRNIKHFPMFPDLEPAY